MRTSLSLSPARRAGPSVIRCLATLALALGAALAGRAEGATPDADLAVLGGSIVTLDAQRPSASALAVRGGRIAIIGDDAEVAACIGAKTRVIQLQGELVLPGFIEGHGHFLGLGQSKRILDLSAARTWEEIVEMVRGAAQTTPPGRWIMGRGWHQDKWIRPPEPQVDGYPAHTKLSQATPRHPVLLTHASGHMCLANALAMSQAGVDEDAVAGEGGEILRDSAGAPLGVFREKAAGLIRSAYQRSRNRRSEEEKRRELRDEIRMASRECLQHGVTTFCDAGEPFAVIDTFKELALRGELPVRLWVMVNEGNESLARRMTEYRILGAGGHHLTVRAVKRLIDGALGTHGAWLLAPYEDLPESRGLNTLRIESLRRTAKLAMENGFQLCVHAIGDRANRETLNVFEEAFQSARGERDLRWRIEHAQHLDPADLPRLAQLGVIASMQGVHCTSDSSFVVRRLGPVRAEQGAYAWRSLLDAGTVIVNGTDTPVERVDPIACFYASVTRKPDHGPAFYPRQCMTREEAIRSYTLDAAYAAFEEDLKGSLTPGKLADIVVLSKNILTAPEEEIRSARVLYTIVGGRVLYERGRAPAG